MNVHMMRLLTALLLLAGSAWAVDETWNAGGSDNNWSTTANWGASVPDGTGDSATITGSSGGKNPIVDANITLNGLIFDGSAGDFTITGSSTLTMGGSNPIIEVVTGTQTLNCQFAVNGDLSIIVHDGASLTIGDTAVSITDSVTDSVTVFAIGSGAVTFLDTTGPIAPGVTSVSSANDATPTWTWTGDVGVGTGNFRYKLDDSTLTSGATLTSTATFTPSAALGDGSHTLYVQERDAIGNWSATGSFAVTIDATAPHIVSRQTRDTNLDGHIDAIDVTFSEAMNGAFGTWTVDGYTFTSSAWQSTTVLRVTFSPLSAYDTDATPTLRCTAAAGLADAAGNAFAAEASSSAATDKAAPVIVRAGGVAGSTSLVLTFSEGVATNTAGADLVLADFTYGNTNGSGAASISSVTQAVGTGGSAALAVNAAFIAGDLTGDTIAAASGASIFDLAGNAMATTAKTLSAGPAAPSFTAPTASTVDATPTWSWTTGGGSGTYRFKLDDSTLTSGATTTTLSSFTPGAALADGSHTLYLQESDAFGVWSATTSRAVVIDATAPHILARATQDVIVVNGQLDAVHVTFDEPMLAAQTGTWTVAGYAVGTPAWQSTTVLRLPLTELTSPDTGALPVVRYVSGSMQDTAGNLLATEAVGTAAADAAAPMLLTAVGSGNTVTITFSEPVVTTGAGAGNLQTVDFTYAGGGASLSGYSDANALDQTATFTTTGTVNSGVDTVGAASGQVYDLSGNAMGTATVVVAAPVTTKNTVAPGDWNNTATWQDGTLPQYTDNVVIKHAVTITQNGSDYFNYQINSLTIDGGSLTATNDVSSGSYFTLITPNARLIEAKTSATITNVQFYDSYYSNSGVETVYKVASGCTLTLTNTNQGHFTGTVVKQGAGELVWDSPANQYGGYDLGATRIEAGIFRLTRPNGRPSQYALNVFGGATLDLQVDFYPGSLSGQGTITRSTVGTTTLSISNGTWGGQIQDGDVDKLLKVRLCDNGAFTWSGTNTFTGGLDLVQATLHVTGTAAIADTCPVSVDYSSELVVDAPETVGPLSNGPSSVAPTITLNAGLTVNQAAIASTFAGTISGVGGLTLAGSGSGSLTLSGSNSYAGGTVLQAGADLVVSSGSNLGAANGALTFDGGNLSLAGDINLSATACASTADGSPAPATTIAAASSDRPISVTVNDGGIKLSTFSIGLPAFTTAAGQDLTISAGATGDRTVFANIGAGGATWGGRLIASGSPFGWFIKRGAGALELGNASNTWSKSYIRTEAGTLRVSANGALGTVSTAFNTLATAVFDLASDYSAGVVNRLAGTMQVQSGAVTWAGTTVFSGAASPTVAVGGGASLALSGAISGSQPWVKTGAGTLVLSSASGANASLSGYGTVSGGTLEIARDDLLGAGANQLVLSSGGTLAVTASFSSARSVTLNTGGGVVSVPSSLALTLYGQVGGAGSLTKIGAGNLNLTGTNIFSGGSVVQAGVLQVASDAGLGATTSGVTLNGGTLTTIVDQTAGTSRGLAIGSANGTVDVASATTLTWNGAVSGTGTLNKTSAGTLVLGGTNTGYTGGIIVQSGALRATTDSSLGSSSSGTLVQNGASLELSGTITSAEPLQLSGAGVSSAGVVRSLSGTQTLSGAVTLVQVANPANVSVSGALTLSGVISGAGGLLKSGTGDLTLSGTNSFTGVDTITAGRLLVGTNANLGNASNGVVLDGGTLVATASISAAARTLLLTANDGTINVLNGGTILELPGLDTAVGQDLTLAGAGTLLLNMSSGGSIAGNLTSSGTAGLAKAGSGGLAITGSNSAFTTTTTLVAGRLRLDGVIGGPVVVQGGVLGGTGSMGALTVQSGGVVRPGDVLAQGPGVLTASDLTLRTGSILSYDLGTANDLISVSGTATVESGVQLVVLSYPASGSFGDAGYQLINAATSLAYAGSMSATLPNGYSLTSGNARAIISATATALVLTADSSLPEVSAITSASPDGTYYQGQSFDVTVVFSKPITPSGTVSAQLILDGDTINVPVSAGSYPATQLSGTYTIVSGDLTAPDEVNASTVVLGGSITDAVGHSVSTLAATPGTLSSNKNIVIDNFVPIIEVSGASAGDTQPPAVSMNTLEARYFVNTADTTTSVHVLASDQETSDQAQLVYRVLLEPSQGAVQVLISGAWGTGTTKKVVTTVTDSATQVDTFTQADINAGNVRYQHTSTSGGNDAILFNVTDGDGKTSALYLLRFTVSGNAVPVISGLPASLTYIEESTHAVWLPITSVGNVTDNDSAFSDGRLSAALTNPQSGDQLDLRPDAVGVTVSGSQISVGALVVGTLTRTSATSLEVHFDDPTTAGPSEAAAIINALGYRTTSMAPDPTIVRSVQISITDGSAGQTPNLYAIPVSITLYNDPPVVTVGSPIVTVPGLARTFTVSVADPEGETTLSYVIASPPSPQATRGALVQNSAGNFTYTPYYPSDSAVGDPLLDSFAITVTDAAFTPGAADPRRRGTAAAATSDPYAYNVRISDGGGLAPRFLAPMRMTVASSLPFSYQPQVQTADGAVLTWELVDVPAQLTTALGLAPPNQASFDTVSGQLSWPAVPIPADGTGYFRFGILVTDTTSQTATLLPVMLRVGPGGAG